MNISVLSIATGKYIDFIPDLIKSSEENFLKGHDKTYYIFTDKKSSIKIKGNNIVKIYQEKLGWPYDTMMRFHMFLSIKEKIEKSKFTFFLNANMEFKEEIGEEILPNLENEFLVGVKHPGYFKLEKSYMPYERRKESNFFIEDSDNLNGMYYQGCFNGGESKKWIEMCEILSRKIDGDLNSNIIPIWHDESALNWYFRNLKIKNLDPEYSLPEQITVGDFSPSTEGNIHCYGFLEKSKPFIIQRDKRKYGGSDFLRNNF
jgi:hypothetical protein